MVYICIVFDLRQYGDFKNYPLSFIIVQSDVRVYGGELGRLIVRVAAVVVRFERPRRPGPNAFGSVAWLGKSR